MEQAYELSAVPPVSCAIKTKLEIYANENGRGGRSFKAKCDGNGSLSQIGYNFRSIELTSIPHEINTLSQSYNHYVGNERADELTKDAAVMGTTLDLYSIRSRIKNCPWFQNLADQVDHRDTYLQITQIQLLIHGFLIPQTT